ncbi:MAG: sensor histidine kinase [Gammaproteobacteria bacterium]|nr:sensor histidine kinase [Gammaproteobacteria bacterium]
MDRTVSRAQKLTALYTIVALSWVLISDLFLAQFSASTAVLPFIYSIGKGWLFIGVTSALLYRLLCRYQKFDEELLRQLRENQQRHLAQELSRQSAEYLRKLSRRLLSVQEEERRALARELHDDLGQQLTALKLNLGILGRNLTNAGNQRRIADCLEIVDHTLEHIRDTARNLRPAMLDDLGLSSALHWFARRQTERTGCVIKVQDHLPPLSAELEIAVFRIAQEAVNNAIRHGQAQSIIIAIHTDDQELTLTIQDNGGGFELETPPTHCEPGMGLSNMRERAELLGGQWTLASRPGEGATVKVILPLLEKRYESDPDPAS